MRNILFYFTVIIFFTDFTFAQEIEQFLLKTTYEANSGGWQEEKNCKLTLKSGNLCVTATGVEPSILRLSNRMGGQIRVVVRLRTRKESAVSLYWTTAGSPRRSDDKKVVHTLINDGEWHDYEFTMQVADRLAGMSMRFSTAEGYWEIASMTAYRRRPHPLLLQKVEDYVLTADDKERRMFRLTVYNDLTIPLTVKADNLYRKEKEPQKDDTPKYEFWYGIKTEIKEPPKDDEDEPPKVIPPPFEKISEIIIPARKTIDFAVPVDSEGLLDAAVLTLMPNDFSPVSFPVFRYRGENKSELTKEHTLPLADDWFIDVAEDARSARIRQKDNTVVIIAPLVHRNGVVPKFKLKEQTADGSRELLFESDDVTLEIRNEKGRVRFFIENTNSEKQDTILEGPVVRLLGTLQSGVLPGVEFLGKGDVSSSPITLIEPYNERSVPPVDWITSPFSFFATEKAAVLLHWADAALQPVFSSPNRRDFTDEHWLSLRGTKIAAALDVLPPFPPSSQPVAVSILHKYFSEHPFPDPPPQVRTEEEAAALCRKALMISVQGEDGHSWGYAAEPDWQRKPFADVLSVLFRLNGKIPAMKNLVSGGSDIANDTSFFLLGKAEQYGKERRSTAESYLSAQNPDGSFFYRTRFSEVEQCISSFGVTAVWALGIMEYVRLTGDTVYFEAVKKALAYLSSYDVPRGGFFRENPLHTPDLYSAASATWLAVWAYEFSGDKEYLKLANRFAAMGLPFVYLHGGENSETDRIMLYAAIPRLGGENRQLPLSFGVAHPQTGIVYAYALHLLSKHDKTFEWNKVALGICRTAEMMQYPGGDVNAGCVPARFDIAGQERRSWKVNPCSLFSLRTVLEGKIDSLTIVSDGKRRYAAPFPLKVTATGLEAVDVPEEQPFQILQDGNRIINAKGSGRVNTD
ncbi:MAG: hypothetical protein FWE67_11135 [Planctomycetaceae bacterium]|nr:hypothetical protein [Planctomycetaceae bacterium]